MMIILILFYVLAPAGVIWLCRKFPFLGKIGPILLLYILGVIVGNIGVIPENALSLQNTMTSGLIPIAIPMMLFTLNFRKFSIKKSVLTLICGCVSVAIMVVIGFLLLRNHLGPDGWKIGGMLAGVETGGTPNMAALQLAFRVPTETYVILTTYDMIVCFLYLVFLMSYGIKFFRRILPRTGITATAIAAEKDDTEKKLKELDPYVGIFKWKNMKHILVGFLFSLVILAISFAVAAFAGGGFSRSLGEIMNGSSFMVVLILCLTTLGIAASFLPRVQKLEKSYDGGMYLVYIFSIVIASMADLRRIDFSGGLYLLLFVVIVVFGSLIVQTLLSKLMRIDADTMVISSVSLINSPPFVPMIAASMKNKDAIIPGIAVGIVGYAVGNYLGLAVAQLLRIL